MNRLAAYALLAILLWQICHRSMVVLYWQANQKFIAANLCEKRNTELADCCKGKCFLRKEFGAEKPSPIAPAHPVKALFEAETLFLLPELPGLNLCPFATCSETKVHLARYQTPFGRDFTATVLRPPTA